MIHVEAHFPHPAKQINDLMGDVVLLMTGEDFSPLALHVGPWGITVRTYERRGEKVEAGVDIMVPWEAIQRAGKTSLERGRNSLDDLKRVLASLPELGG